MHEWVNKSVCKHVSTGLVLVHVCIFVFMYVCACLYVYACVTVLGSIFCSVTMKIVRFWS